jgi:stress-induced morphogen
MAIPYNHLLSILKEAFPTGDISLTDLVGDEDHYQVEIKDAQFNELNKIQQHRLVHASLGEKLGTQLHALSIRTYPKV